METVGLSNFYLLKLLRGNLEVENFCDVFSSDTISKAALQWKDERRPCIIIVNTAKYSEQGEHFICILVERNLATVYDSLALRLETVCPEIIIDFKKNGKNVSFALSEPIQSETSAYCGVYCIYFTLMLSPRQFPKREGLQKFSRADKARNDEIVLHNVKTLLKNNAQN